MLLTSIAKHYRRILGVEVVDPIDLIPWDFIWPLTSNLLPSVGSVDIPTEARLSLKYPQVGENSGQKLDWNELAPAQWFGGAQANGLALEGTSTNGLDDVNDMGISATWPLSEAMLRGVGYSNNPFGVEDVGGFFFGANDINSKVYQETAIDIAEKDVYWGAWAKAFGSSVPFQTKIIAKKASGESSTLDMNVTGDWKLFHKTNTFGAGSSNLTYEIYPDSVTGSRTLMVSIPFAYVNNAGQGVVETPHIGTRQWDQLTLPAPPVWRGDQGSMYLEIYPLFHPGDGKDNDLFYISPIVDGEVLSKLILWKRQINTLVVTYQGSAFNGCGVAVNNTNFARLAWHKIGVTYNSSAVKLFLNGTKVNQDTSIGGSYQQVLPLTSTISIPADAAARSRGSVYRDIRYRSEVLDEATMETITT